jgi:hypothetical protein
MHTVTCSRIDYLHLSSEPDGTGFNKRGVELLFAIVIPGAAYAVAVGTHGDWTALRLVKAIVHSWPLERFFLPLNSIKMGKRFTPREHQGLRSAGLTTAAQVNEAVYISRLTGGLTTALVSNAISNEASRTLRTVLDTERDRSHVIEQLRNDATARNLHWPEHPRVGVVRGSAPL